METILPLLKEAEEFLVQHGIENPRLNAEELLGFVLKRDRCSIYLDCLTLSTRDSEKYKELLTKRASHVPLQHLLGTQQFRDVELFVGPGVFIPRPETELMGTYLDDLIRLNGLNTFKCLEIGTGTGAIPLSLVQEHPEGNCVALDVSSSACEWAEKNFAKYPELNPQITLIQMDCKDFYSSDRFDFVISNPPYIPKGLIPTLPKEVRDSDPLLALDGGDDGLEVIRKIADGCHNWLKPGGWLLLEIGEDQGEEVVRLLKSKSFSQISVKPDLTERDRFVVAKWDTSCKN
ncbi:MAG TPA: peptide chain release factor N(5)-glutamine methyltransferase [Bdellovibrionota bacterium]|nr:peptide chain release factor N(5)-glutamine methyltransferase [Bdellovibrionota bacterium]